MTTTVGATSTQDVIKQLLAGTGDLPVLPEIAIRLMEELRAPNVTAARIAQYVKKDPILAAAVLRVANSALYGGRSQITDLAFAMSRIGLMQTRNLILALVLRSKMSDTNVYGSAGAKVLDHSLAVAFGARLVADAARVDADDAGLCGLLHDFGRLALIKALRESAGMRVGDLSPDQMSLVDEHHAEAGSLLAARWGLPELVCSVIREHHRCDAPSAPQPSTACVSLADAAAHKLGLGGDADSSIDLIKHPAVRLLRLDKQALDGLCEHLPGLFDTARGAMS
ncbi:MAG: HDOD domain-containing protein [Acidobacteriota bacterium]